METEIVEFMDGDTLKIGLVSKRSASRIQVTDQNGKQQSLNSRQILLIHNNKSSSNEFNEYARLYLDSVKMLADEIDTELLWENIEKKDDNLDPEIASQIYFGDSDTINQSAIIRAAVRDNLHFKTKGVHILVRDSHQVEEQKHVQQKKAEKQAINERFITWAANLLEGETSQPPVFHPEFLPFLNSLEQSLSNEGYNLEPWLQELIRYHSGPFRSRAETIVLILVGGNRLPENADPFILESGVPLEFSEASLEEAERIRVYNPGPEDIQAESGVIFSIDDEDTEEIDDAVSITESDNHYQIGIHIADAASFIAPGSLLDQEAALRYTSIYLPHSHIRMLPESFSCDLLSLRENQVRPVVSCNLLVSKEMEIVEWNFSRNFLQVQKNLTYCHADTLLGSANPTENPSELQKGLLVLKIFADKLLQERIEKGALVINRPEIKISIKNGKIELNLLEPDSPSRLIISELAILYNSLAAGLASQNQVPFIFRSQKKPEKEIPEFPAVGYDHFAAYNLFSALEPSVTGLETLSHFGLGLDAYAQVTSPIRRYTDLLNQRQLCSYISGEVPVHTAEKLEEHLGGLASADRLTRNLERKTNRLFTLRFLLQDKRKEFDLVVLQNIKGGYLVESIPECYRGTLASSEELLPGTRLKARISKIDPESDTLQFTSEL